MLAAIDFDDQARLVASKIDDVNPEGHLPPKLVPVDLTRSQDLPDASFRVGHMPPQGLRTPLRPGCWMFFQSSTLFAGTSPPPNPPHRGGGQSTVLTGYIGNTLDRRHG
jgi:hypothetical protein